MVTRPDSDNFDRVDTQSSAAPGQRSEQLHELGMRPDTARTARTMAEVVAMKPATWDPATSDEVTILNDGRRIETLADAKAWIAEMDADR